MSATDGHKVYEHVRKGVIDGDRVSLSFSGITRMTTAFLNAAVGQLYGEFSETEIRKHLADPIDFEPWHIARLRLVVERAKDYFRDTSKTEKAFASNTGHHADDI